MAKKSPSVSKKTAKSVLKTKAKPVKKPVPKLASKAASKPAAKATKVVKKPVLVAKKDIKKVTPKPVVNKTPAKTSVKTPMKTTVQTPTKTPAKVEIAKPALMTKKGKPVEESAVIEETATLEAAPLKADKAEKVGKVKPIRIEKGNAEDEKAKWAELFKKYGKDKAINYKMSETFPSLSPLQHKVLGWGFILKNDNDRLEVLFETGIRMLISNYKS